MAKQQSINEVIQSLQDAQQNKELLDGVMTTLEKFVQNQRTALDELETLITNAKSGKLPVVKKRGGYRGRKNKAQVEG
jgi:hypothetical protein